VEHKCDKESEIGVLMDFKARTEKYVDSITVWMITHLLGYIISIIGIVYLIFKLVILKKP
jgi:hypothetical protein